MAVRLKIGVLDCKAVLSMLPAIPKARFIARPVFRVLLYLLNQPTLMNALYVLNARDIVDTAVSGTGSHSSMVYFYAPYLGPG